MPGNCSKAFLRPAPVGGGEISCQDGKGVPSLPHSGHAGNSMISGGMGDLAK